MLYILEKTDKLDEGFLDRAIPLLSLQRIRKLDELRILSDRINSAAVYLMLRYALKNEYGICEAPGFTFGERGKPSLADEPDVRFNFSHCRNSCACIVDRMETAVDISDIRRISFRTAEYFCSPEELERVQTAGDQNRELVKLWTVKECFSKLTGKGLITDFRTISEKESGSIRSICRDDYVVSYSADKALEPVILSADQLIHEC